MEFRLRTLLIFKLMLISHSEMAIGQESTCYGETKNGRLESGIKLPYSGDNFEGYSFSLQTIGRTYVHSKVSKIVIDSYKDLKNEQPEKVYKYAETGLKNGGRFRPHKTHQNGLSVDFMVPVTNYSGVSVHLPTNPLNKWGYNIEFDEKGFTQGYIIDFEAMGAHIVSLHKSAKKNDADIWRVIFDPALQKLLLDTKYGSYIERHIQLSKKKSWVRHDEHYHVDFEIPCQAM